jgi:Zn-dependent peptidase ImmA (M78 family)
MDKPRYDYAKQMARKVLGDCKVAKPPVDLKPILSKKGYEYVEVANFLDNVDALFLRDESDGRIYAAVNSKHHVHRQRFSLAHEFGHILLNHNLNYYRSHITLDEPPTEKMHTTVEAAFETEANCFAGELLVPLEMLKAEFRKTTDLGQLAKVFWVSQHVVSISVSSNLKSLYK